MFARYILIPALLLGLLAFPAGAAEAESGDVYCFGSGDFDVPELEGICVTGLPAPATGVLMLDDRVIRPGDVLTAAQLERLTFLCRLTESDAAATLSYLPVTEEGIGSGAEVTISIRGKENHPPVAEDFAAETYKNLPLEGKLKVKDPEEEAMTYTLVRGPKRGTVELREDGSFTYTPKKNKVGIDSFVFTATDASGKVSREATVTITIVKPTDAAQYTDTVGLDCRFAAEWMKNTGIFVGERLDGHACFSPERPVSLGEFAVMLVRALEIPTEAEADVSGGEAPVWMQPYLAAAARSGLLAGFSPAAAAGTITEADAAVMIGNLLDQAPAAEAPDEPLTRARAAVMLYDSFRLAQESPGIAAMARK